MPRRISGALGERSSFSLDTSGVAGFFGGDEAVSAMGVVHLYAGRRWFGWYNAPGSYEIGRKYGQLARSRFWDGIFPGPNVEPEILFELDGQRGPTFEAFHDGPRIAQTGHIGYLFMKQCETVSKQPDERPKSSDGVEKHSGELLKQPSMASRRYGMVPKRTRTKADSDDTDCSTETFSVVVAKLDHSPKPSTLAEKLEKHTAALSVIPMLVSIACCALCAVYSDWYSFAMILLGIVCSGVSCFIIGSADLHLEHTPSSQAGSGDGLLMQDDQFVVLLGSADAVNFVTKGKFSLKFPRWTKKAGTNETERMYRSVGFCSLLLLFQFLAQLFLIPQGVLFGQILFLVSMGVSWLYNLYLSSLDREDIQCDMLVAELQPLMKRYTKSPATKHYGRNIGKSARENF